jgi:hypothetical protein
VYPEIDLGGISADLDGSMILLPGLPQSLRRLMARPSLTPTVPSSKSQITLGGNTEKVTESDVESSEDSKGTPPTAAIPGGANFGDMASAPQGYALYLSLRLVDAKFYSSQVIYATPTVDNRDILRSLWGASEQRFNQMIDHQYRRKP